MYEDALIHAVTGARTSNRHFPAELLRCLLTDADRERLRAAGTPWPTPHPEWLYRGVAGRGRARRVRGFSWSSTFEIARWFAQRYPGLDDPAVFAVRFDEVDVLAYTDDRTEDEYVVLVQPLARVIRSLNGEGPKARTP